MLQIKDDATNDKFKPTRFRKIKSMEEIGRYCKAYPVSYLQRFPQWAIHYKAPEPADGDTLEFLYFQEHLTVTLGFFKDENVVFDAVTPEWQKFCAEQLKFVLPPYLKVEDPKSA